MRTSKVARMGRTITFDAGLVVAISRSSLKIVSTICSPGNVASRSRR